MDAIILSGGSGTRLREEISGIPKSMAPINNQPFLNYILKHLNKNDVQKVIMSLGYKKEYIISHFGNEYRGMEIVYHCEESPLGTGGAVKKSIEMSTDSTVLVLNGDTYFPVNIARMVKKHQSNRADVTVGLKYLENCYRYGCVTMIDERINKFKEKKSASSGFINGGVYLLNKEIIADFESGTSFSLEKDFFEQCVDAVRIFGFVSDKYFIDIGTPEEYRRAVLELSKLV